jgi:hypothetical protein
MTTHSTHINNVFDVEKLKNNTSATLTESRHTASMPEHYECPHYKASWCFYNKNIATGGTTKPHNKMVHNYS